MVIVELIKEDLEERRDHYMKMIGVHQHKPSISNPYIRAYRYVQRCLAVPEYIDEKELTPEVEYIVKSDNKHSGTVITFGIAEDAIATRRKLEKEFGYDFYVLEVFTVNCVISGIAGVKG